VKTGTGHERGIDQGRSQWQEAKREGSRGGKIDANLENGGTEIVYRQSDFLTRGGFGFAVHPYSRLEPFYSIPAITAERRENPFAKLGFVAPAREKKTVAQGNEMAPPEAEYRADSGSETTGGGESTGQARRGLRKSSGR
jgi:hypothetical protein